MSMVRGRSCREGLAVLYWRFILASFNKIPSHCRKPDTIHLMINRFIEYELASLLSLNRITKMFFLLSTFLFPSVSHACWVDSMAIIVNIQYCEGPQPYLGEF